MTTMWHAGGPQPGGPDWLMVGQVEYLIDLLDLLHFTRHDQAS